MDNEDIIEKLVNYLSGIENATTIAYSDFTEERTNNMIVVGIDNVTQVNFGLPDWKYELTVLVDSYIDQDLEACAFNSIMKTVIDRLCEYTLDNSKLEGLFGDLEIVYFNIDNVATTITEKSNRCTTKITIIQSKLI